MEREAEALDRKEKTVWAFGGGKGGTGKTFVVANLGILLARKGHDVVLFDGDLGGANLHTAIGLPRPGATLTDFTHGDADTLDDIIVATDIPGLRLIPGAWDELNGANPNYAIKSKLIKHLKGVPCEFLLIDMGAGTGYNILDLFLEADAGVIVITPDPSAVELAYRFIKAVIYRRLKALAARPMFHEYIDEELKDNRSCNHIGIIDRIIDRIGAVDWAAASRIESEVFDISLSVIINMAQEQQDQCVGPAMCDVVEKFYGPPMDSVCHIPFDERVFRAERKGRPFVVEYGASETAARFSLALERLVTLAQAAGRTQLKLM